MIVLPEDWPYRAAVRYDPRDNARITEIGRWLEDHVGQRGQAWHMSFGFWLFRRQDDHALFQLTWG